MNIYKKSNKITKELAVKQDNFFIQYSNQAKFTEIQKKIILYALSKVNEKIDNNINDVYNVSINVNELIKTLYKTNKIDNELKRFYRYLKNECVKIRNKGIELYYIDNENIEHILITSIFLRIDINIKGKINILFDNDILDNYIKIYTDKNYTKLKIKNIIELNNKYALRVYEILKSYENLLNNNYKNFTINNINYEIINNNTLKIIYNKEYIHNILLEKKDNGEYKNKSYIKNSNLLKVKVLQPLIKDINDANIDIKIKDFAKDTENKDNYIIICEYIKNNKSYNADNKNIYKTDKKEKENKYNKKVIRGNENEQYNILFDKWEKIGFGV